jgi:hypothetical protein
MLQNLSGKHGIKHCGFEGKKEGVPNDRGSGLGIRAKVKSGVEGHAFPQYRKVRHTTASEIEERAANKGQALRQPVEDGIRLETHRIEQPSPEVRESPSLGWGEM